MGAMQNECFEDQVESGSIVQVWYRDVRNVEKNVLIIQCNSAKIRGEFLRKT